MTKLIRKAQYGMFWNPPSSSKDEDSQELGPITAPIQGNFQYTNISDLFNVSKGNPIDITGMTQPTNTNTNTNINTTRSTQNQVTPFKLSGNTKNKADVCKMCYQAFSKAGATDAAAKGILANIVCEGNFNPGSFGWDGSEKKGQFGIGGGLFGFYYHGGLPKLAKMCGWSKAKLDQLNEQIKNSGLPQPRKACSSANKKHIEQKFGDFPFTLEQQLSYIVKTPEFQAVKNYTDPSEAAWYWMKKYEKPANQSTDRWAKAKDKVAKLLA